MDASDTYHRRIKAKEVLISQKDDEFVFPIRRWNSKVVRKRLRILVPTLEDLSGEIQGESEESQPAEPTDYAEARTAFWSIQGDFIYRHHAEPRVQLYVPKEEAFSIPRKYIDVTGSTHTDLDVMQEKKMDAIAGMSIHASICQTPGKDLRNSLHW